MRPWCRALLREGRDPAIDLRRSRAGYDNQQLGYCGKEANVSNPVVEVEGTLRPDGTLVLDASVNLPPGRVRVAVRPVEAGADVMEVLARIRAEQAASGHSPRSREQIDADVAAMRQEDEERMQGIERLHEECRRAGGRGPGPGQA
jgi:hypothetical protein